VTHFQKAERFLPALVLLLLVLGLVMRVYDPYLDPPSAIGSISQDLVTDPAHITSFAANKALFGTWEPFPFPKWQVFKVALPSLIAYLLFSIGKVNYFWSSMAGVIPSFIGLLLIIWSAGIGQKPKQWLPILVAALLLMPNFSLVTYNRASFLECGLILYFGVMVFLVYKYPTQLWSLLLTAFLIPLACLTGKAFGLSMALALGTTLIFGHGDKKWKNIGLMSAVGVVSFIALLYLFYGGRIGAYSNYLNEQALTSHGTLDSIQSLRKLVEALLSYGTVTRMFRASPFLFLSAYLALLFAFFYFRTSYDAFRNNLRLRLALYWALALFLMFFPFNYRPLRYSILLYLPLALIIASVCSIEDFKKKNCPPKMAIFSVIALFALNYYFLIHFVLDMFLISGYPSNAWTVYSFLFPVAVIATILMVQKKSLQALARLLPKAKSVLVPLAVGALIFQSALYIDWARYGIKTIQDAADDLSEILDPSSVLTGPYAPRLTIGSSYRHFIYAFGLKRPETSIFDMFPISHVVVDLRNLEAASKDYPEIAKADPIADYLVRGRTIFILKMPRTIPGYHQSDYETAAELLLQGNNEAAQRYNLAFLQKFPNNASARRQLAKIYLAEGKTDSMVMTLDELRRNCPDNISIQFFCAMRYEALGRSLGSQDLLQISRETLEHAKRLDPTFQQTLQEYYDQTKSRL
jgi:hypothetical protein